MNTPIQGLNWSIHWSGSINSHDTQQPIGHNTASGKQNVLDTGLSQIHLGPQPTLFEETTKYVLSDIFSWNDDINADVDTLVNADIRHLS